MSLIPESNCQRHRRLVQENKHLRANSTAMYELFGTLQNELKPECFNANRKWSNGECEIIRQRIHNVWSKVNLAEVCALTGRTPYAVFNCFLYVLWEDVKAGDRALFERTMAQMPERYRRRSGPAATSVAA